MVITGYENIENLTARIAVLSGTNAMYVSDRSVTVG